MRRKSFPDAHQSSSYKTFRLTLESREDGGGAGNLFVCLSLLETIINYGDCQSRTHWQIRLPGGGEGGGCHQYNYGQSWSVLPPCPGTEHLNTGKLSTPSRISQAVAGWDYSCTVVTGGYVNWMSDFCHWPSPACDWHLHEKIWIIIFLL